MVINANIIPPLVSILRNEEFDIQKEAAWAISNATSGGTDAQIRYLANQGVIQPLCELFTCPDSKIIMVRRHMHSVHFFQRSEHDQLLTRSCLHRNATNDFLLGGDGGN